MKNWSVCYFKIRSNIHMESGLVLTSNSSKHIGKNMQKFSEKKFIFLRNEVKIAELGIFS
jgi:hypothetical protein